MEAKINNANCIISKVNKAQEKRNRENTNFINSDLRRKLIDFENKYLNSCVQYEFNARNFKIKKMQDEIIEFPTRVITKANQRTTIDDLERRIKRLEREIELGGLLTLAAIVPAKASFDEKVNRLVALLVAEGFGYSHYKIEAIKNCGDQLAFLISKEDKEVHARLIWVDGVIQTPHFRFITTTRKIG